jgi:hypothetical protein
MSNRIRSSFDRRSGVDRRIAYTVGYFLEGGTERRSGRERRCMVERRKDWIEISQGSSVWVKHFDPMHRSVELGDVIQAQMDKGAALVPTQQDDCSSENLTEGAPGCDRHRSGNNAPSSR